MDMNVSAGLAWAVPVRPDDLGAHLQAYKTDVPVLNGLRLYHKYGKGKAAHITKLPSELLLAVEGHIFQCALDEFSGQWKWLFSHYESRCEPFIDHCEDPSVLYDLKDDYPDELCEACKTFDGSECTAGCDEKVMQLMNERCVSGDTYDWRFESCEPERTRWEEMIDQSAEGDFVEYDKVLQKHFGLEAFFAPTRKTAGSNAPWTEDPNHKWHVSEELKTTICYLTLPYKASSKQNFESSEMEEDCGSWLVEGTQSSFVELPTLANRAKRVKQFRHALRSLMLAPYVHPSQLNDTVTAEVAGKCVEGKEEDDSDRKMSDGCTKVVEKKEWPQLIMLVKTVGANNI